MFEKSEELEESIKGCNKCKLYRGRQNIVCGAGNKESKVMFIGEGPGADEDRIRRTFCWKSRTINGYGISNSWDKKSRNIYSIYC